MSIRALTSLALAGTLGLAGCDDAEPPRPGGQKPIRRPAAAVYCPADVPAARAFDARVVLGMAERRAAGTARKAGCNMVVVVRDGERFGITANYDPRRLQVETKDGVVTRLEGVN